MTSKFEELIVPHIKSLRRTIENRLYSRIKHRADADDVLQEVLIEANRRLDKYLENPKVQIKRWIFKIANDKIIDAYRTHIVSTSRSVNRELSSGPPKEGEILPEYFFSNEKGSEETVEYKEKVDYLFKNINYLRDLDKEVILLRVDKGLGNDEISNKLGISEGTASMRYLRAMGRLKDIINEQ